MSDGWIYTGWRRRAASHQRRDRYSTDVMEVKGWVWCSKENRCHRDRRPSLCVGNHFLLLRTASAPGLRIGKHERRAYHVEVVARTDKTR